MVVLRKRRKTRRLRTLEVTHLPLKGREEGRQRRRGRRGRQRGKCSLIRWRKDTEYWCTEWRILMLAFRHNYASFMHTHTYVCLLHHWVFCLTCSMTSYTSHRLYTWHCQTYWWDILLWGKGGSVCEWTVGDCVPWFLDIRWCSCSLQILWILNLWYVCLDM